MHIARDTERTRAAPRSRSGRPMKWRQVIDNMEQIEKRLLDVLLLPKLPKAARETMTETVRDFVLPVLRADGRKSARQPGEPQQQSPPMTPHLHGLTESDMDFYRLLRRKGFAVAEALPMVQRQQPLRVDARA